MVQPSVCSEKPDLSVCTTGPQSRSSLVVVFILCWNTAEWPDSSWHHITIGRTAANCMRLNILCFLMTITFMPNSNSLLQKKKGYDCLKEGKQMHCRIYRFMNRVDKDGILTSKQALWALMYQHSLFLYLPNSCEGVYRQQPRPEHTTTVEWLKLWKGQSVTQRGCHTYSAYVGQAP
jgi:hypothetical protein